MIHAQFYWLYVLVSLVILNITFKPWPNSCNIFNAAYRDIVGHSMLQLLWMSLDVVGIWPGSFNKVALGHVHKFNFQYPTCHKRVAKHMQHVVPNNVAICCVEILWPFGQGLQMLGQQCVEMLQWFGWGSSIPLFLYNYVCCCDIILAITHDLKVLRNHLFVAPIASQN